MTLVNTETGEIVESLSVEDARRLTTRIRLMAESIADGIDKIAGLIDDARAGSAWLALGYRSWPEYVSNEFAGVLPRLDREPRQEFVRELASRGMSTRAIAPVVGTSHMSVARDLAAPVTDVTPEPLTTAPSVAREQAPQGEVAPEAPVTPSVEPSMPRPAVTGLDGKSYAPRPPKPVLDGGAAEYANAEKASLALSRAVSKLLEFQHPNMRDGMRRYWSMASSEVPPTPRRDVTPEQMRVAAHGLLTLADEWGDA